MFTLQWMPNPELCRDEIELVTEDEHAALVFRHPDVSGLIWTFDGDGWSSETTFWNSDESDMLEVGNFYITWLP